jgi:hypothetical protein
MPPEEEKPAKVLDLVPRLLERVPTFEIRADLESQLVALTFRHPERGEVAVGLEIAQVVRAIEGLMAEGAKLASRRWQLWAAHVGESAGTPSGRLVGNIFARFWPSKRPDILMRPRPSRGVIVEAAARLAEEVAQDPIEASRLLAHLADDDGTPLLEGCPPEATLVAAGHFLVRWDSQ